MTLVDTNVLLDVLVQGARHADESARRLDDAYRAGPVVVNDVIAAELAPAFETEADLWATLTGSEIAVQSFPRAAVFLAGTAYRAYRRRGGTRRRMLPDFMIGAHAVAEGCRLLTRDRGFYRDYFSGLRLA
jgi:predicted nucleic acid-binding protein